MLYHLVYISYATYPFSEKELEDLLRASQRYNKQNGITGMLLYLNEKFIQILEGETEAVEKLMDIIEVDPRHRKVSVILQGATHERVFKSWSMGFKRLGLMDFKELSGYADPNEFFVKMKVTNESSPLLIFLRLFYQKNMNDLPELA